MSFGGFGTIATAPARTLGAFLTERKEERAAANTLTSFASAITVEQKYELRRLELLAEVAKASAEEHRNNLELLRWKKENGICVKD